jgi:urease accessory protein UreH
LDERQVYETAFTVDQRAATPVRGRLELVFAACSTGTVLAHAYVSAPLKIVRPFQLAGGGLLVQVITLGPGLCAGDDCRMDITVESGARAVVVMQAASRILGMPEGAQATQSVNLVVAPGGQIEYYPGLTIPFAESCFRQRVTIRADRQSRVGLLECWATGRQSRREYLRFRHLSSRTIVTVNDQPSFADAVEIDTTSNLAAGAGILEGHRYFASGFWHGVPADASIALTATDALMAFGRTSSPDQVFLRALAHDGFAITGLLQSVVDVIGQAWGHEAIPIRRFVS